MVTGKADKSLKHGLLDGAVNVLFIPSGYANGAIVSQMTALLCIFLLQLRRVIG